MGSYFSINFKFELMDRDIGDVTTFEQNISTVISLMKKYKNKILIITGAGISSHVLPTFRSRSCDALWDIVESPLDINHFYENPKKFWQLISYFKLLEKSGALIPSLAHKVIHHLLKEGYCYKVITQNIDSLHSFYGDEKDVIELHGKITDYGICDKCNVQQVVDFSDILNNTTDSPRCNICSFYLRPPVAFFYDLIPEYIRDSVNKDLSRAEVIILVGTYGAVDPVLSYVLRAKSEGIILIEINTEATNISKYADIKLEMKADKAFLEIGESLFPDIMQEISESNSTDIS